jgi:hypothetical protein
MKDATWRFFTGLHLFSSLFSSARPIFLSDGEENTSKSHFGDATVGEKWEIGVAINVV